MYPRGEHRHKRDRKAPNAQERPGGRENESKSSKNDGRGRGAGGSSKEAGGQAQSEGHAEDRKGSCLKGQVEPVRAGGCRESVAMFSEPSPPSQTGRGDHHPEIHERKGVTLQSLRTGRGSARGSIVL